MNVMKVGTDVSHSYSDLRRENVGKHLSHRAESVGKHLSHGAESTGKHSSHRAENIYMAGTKGARCADAMGLEGMTEMR